MAVGGETLCAEAAGATPAHNAALPDAIHKTAVVRVSAARTRRLDIGRSADAPHKQQGAPAFLFHLRTVIFVGLIAGL